jgi:hypothetical protein
MLRKAPKQLISIKRKKKTLPFQTKDKAGIIA